jgi:23S rRNA (pseudouridine1915-N3)-methyltransferase
MIKIICVGRIKEKYLVAAIEEYKKRLSKYTKLEIIEVNDIDNSNIETILLKEKDLIEKHIDPKDFVITLEIDGNMLNSIEFAKKIDNIFNTNSTITFIIGGSYGLHSDIKIRSNYKLSFSKLTFPHQLFRVNLLEQIYRVYKINNNEAYHK